jgi:ATP adenylyltransferase
MAYVGGSNHSEDCVFCRAYAGDDDVASFVVHRGEHVFVILNLFPYNTGHLMVVPNDHVDELSSLAPATRQEMAELTASFCTGLRSVMGCDGFNTGMNLGSAAGAGIADHLHQHIVPRWIGDANFMPLIGGTKVLPEEIPATYARIRAEVARQAGSVEEVALVIETDTGEIAVDGDRLPRVPLDGADPAWKQARVWLTHRSGRFELLGWAGPASVSRDTDVAPILAYRATAQGVDRRQLELVSRADAIGRLGPEDAAAITAIEDRFPPPAAPSNSAGNL